MTNLLLLLSAMLSALVGAGPVARAQQAPVTVASVAQGDAVAVPSRSLAARPPAPLPILASLLWLGVVAFSRLPAAIPAWKMRRRE